MENITYESLKDRYAVFERNRDINGFTLHLTTREDGSPVIKAKASVPVEDTCFDAFASLIKELTYQALLYGMNIISSWDIEEDDLEDYFTLWTDQFEIKQTELMEVFLQEGLDAFLNHVFQMEMRIHYAYLIENLGFTGDRIFTTKGYEIVECIRAKKSDNGTIIFCPDIGIHWEMVTALSKDERCLLSSILRSGDCDHETYDILKETIDVEKLYPKRQEGIPFSFCCNIA